MLRINDVALRANEFSPFFPFVQQYNFICRRQLHLAKPTSFERQLNFICRRQHHLCLQDTTSFGVANFISADRQNIICVCKTQHHLPKGQHHLSVSSTSFAAGNFCQQAQHPTVFHNTQTSHNPDSPVSPRGHTQRVSVPFSAREQWDLPYTRIGIRHRYGLPEQNSHLPH